MRRPLESTRYLSYRYSLRLEEAGIAPSVGSRGDSYDKARVEERVGNIQRNALAALRNQLFYSIDELNRALIPYVGAVNARPMAGHQTTRAELFEKEREYLRPLPLLPFSYGTWHSVLVPPNYHIELLGCRYSVPHALRGQELCPESCADSPPRERRPWYLGS